MTFGAGRAYAAAKEVGSKRTMGSAIPSDSSGAGSKGCCPAESVAAETALRCAAPPAEQSDVESARVDAGVTTDEVRMSTEVFKKAALAADAAKTNCTRWLGLPLPPGEFGAQRGEDEGTIEALQEVDSSAACAGGASG